MRLVNLFNLIYYKLIHPNKVAKKLGVNFGHNCKFRTKRFGSEPYLIFIGDNFSTSSGVSFITHDGAVEVLRNKYSELKNIDLIKTIEIKDNVFIGMNAIILPGTKIGSNVIIGAGSVVNGELNSNSVYAGVPAKFICSLDQYVDKHKANFINSKHLNQKDKKEFLKSLYKEI